MKDHVVNDEFLKGNFIFFAGSLAIALFNYLYYPVLSRIVSLPDFGEIQAMVSVYTQMIILLTAFGYVITNIVSNSRGEKKDIATIKALERVTFLLACILVAIFVSLVALFGAQLKIDSVFPTLIIGIALLINVPTTTRMYYLQGHSNMAAISLAGLVFSIGKLVLSVGLVYALTNNVIAATLGYAIAQLAMLIFIHRRALRYDASLGLHRYWYAQHMDSSRSIVRKELMYGWKILVVLSCITFMYAFDVMVARLFFDTTTLGLYSGVSAIAKIIFFATVSFSGVLLAATKIGGGHKAANVQLLVRSLKMVGTVGGLGLAVFCIFPHLVIVMLLGEKYAAGSYLLPILSLAMFFASINNLLATYQLSLRNVNAYLTVLIGCGILGAAVVLSHSTPLGFALSYLTANVILCVLLLLGMIRDERGNRI